MSYIYQEDSVELAPEKISTATDPIHGPITVFHDVIIASEMIQPYSEPDGKVLKALKSRDELEAYAWTVEGRWVKGGGHPVDAIISDRSDVNGRTTNAHYVKNLKDPKTGRPCRAGVRADIIMFDKKVSPELLDGMKKGKKSDVSIGFFFKRDDTPGQINDAPFSGEAYDYVQRNMFHDHLAVGLDTKNGRCPSPYCGLGADEIVRRSITGDPFAGFENWAACIAEISSKNPKLPKSEVEGICGNLKAKHEDIIEFEQMQNILAIAKAIQCVCEKDEVELKESGELDKLKELSEEGFFTDYAIQSTKKQIDDKIKEILDEL